MQEPGARTLLRAGLAGLALFAGALAILHLLNLRDLAEHGRHVSNFAWMRGGWLWQAGLIGLGLGTLALVSGLRRTLDMAGPVTWALRALQVAGVAILAMVAFRTDRYLTPDSTYSFVGYLHDTSAVVSTFLLSWAMLLLVAASRVDPALHGVFGHSWLWPLASIGFALAWMLGDVTEYWPIAAFVQRAVILVNSAWLAVMGLRALSTAANAHGTPQPVPPPRPTR